MSSTSDGVITFASGTGASRELQPSGGPETASKRDHSGGRARVVVVVSGWPRVSEVFALNELIALHRRGMLAAVLAVKRGETGPPHPATAEIDHLVEIMPAGDLDAMADLVAKRVAETGATGVHGYFAHEPAAVAAAAADRSGVPYGFSVHALDVRKAAADLGARARGAALVVACNHDAAAEVERAAGAAPRLLRHGVDLTAFRATSPPNGSPVRLLAVGRMVEKKGFDVLLESLMLVDRPVRLQMVGTGVLQSMIERAIETHGLSDRVELVGRLTHAELPAAYAGADIVVVPSIVDRQGDRDGLPNVVLEAMASGRPVIASDVAAIGTAVRDEQTGLLVPPGDAAVLAKAITALVEDPARRLRLGAAAREMVQREFDLEACSAEFCAALEQAYG